MRHRHHDRITLTITAVIVAAALLVSSSCASSSATTQYRTLASVKVAVDTGMKVWADRVIDGKATPAQEAKVRAAFRSYQDAFAIAINAAVTDQAPPTALVSQTAADLLALLASFGAKTGGTP